MANHNFPPMPDMPDPKWVQELDAEGRAENDANREQQIVTDTAKVLSIMHEVVDFSSVGEEAREYFALRLARGLRKAREDGFQIATDIYEPALKEANRRSAGLVDPKYIGV